MDDFLKSPTFNLISLGVGLLGVFLAIYIYIRTRRDVRCFYSVRSFNLIKNKQKAFPLLQLSYNGEDISSATITKLVLVNSGDVPISRNHIAQADPLQIRVSDGAILEASVTAVNNAASAVHLSSVTEDAAAVEFDYFNPRDGAVFRILHTAPSSINVRLSGQIIGLGCPHRIGSATLAPRLLRLFPTSKSSRHTREFRWPLLIASSICTIGIIYLLVKLPNFELLFKSEKALSTQKLRWIISFSGAVTLIPYWWVTWRLFRFSIPKGLEDFTDVTEQA